MKLRKGQTAVQIRLLNEMDKLDQEIAAKKAEEIRKKLEAEAKERGRYDTDLIERQVNKVAEEKGYHCKQVRNISFKKIARTSSWHIENEEDVDRYIDELRSKLMSELDADTIVNIEF